MTQRHERIRAFGEIMSGSVLRLVERQETMEGNHVFFECFPIPNGKGRGHKDIYTKTCSNFATSCV